MAARIQSPSSINTYKQCPRKYYYQYIQKIPTKDNKYTVRGKIAHTVLEKFFDIDTNLIKPDSYKEDTIFYLKNLFNGCWAKNKERFKKLGMHEEDILMMKNETAFMLSNWITDFFKKLELKLKNISLEEAFKELKPVEREVQYKDEGIGVRGFIDIVECENDIVKLIDYKTSKLRGGIPDSYRLQLAIYALLYEKKHSRKPDKVGIWYLSHKEITVDVTDELLKEALAEIKQIHLSTESNEIKDYPKKVSRLCKWHSGQCDFFRECKPEAEMKEAGIIKVRQS